MTLLANSSIAIARLIFIIVFGSALVGSYVGPLLPERCKTEDIKDAAETLRWRRFDSGCSSDRSADRQN